MGRDVEVIDQQDAFAFAKRVNGFIPKTIFYKDETALLNTPEEVLFFQDFGIPHPSQFYQTISERIPDEITLGDIYNVLNRVGRWVDAPRIERRRDAVAWLMEHGFELPGPHRTPVGRELPVWPPKLELVPEEREWTAVMQQEEQRQIEIQIARWELNDKIAKACALCQKGERLVLKGGYAYRHGISYHHLQMCEARKLHDKRGTFAYVLMDPAVQREA